MRPLQMVDTKNQYHKIKTEVDTAVLSVLESSAFIGGKVVTSFADNLAKYHNSKHCIPCANGTDALQIAMMALGLQPGDEVITPSFTYIATVEVAALLHIKPVFIEVDAKTFCIDPAAIEKAITPKTKAIIPVHLYGQAANMETIMKIAAAHNLFVIEDNAQGIGNDYTFSDGKKAKDKADSINSGGQRSIIINIGKQIETLHQHIVGGSREVADELAGAVREALRRELYSLNGVAS